MLKRFLMLTAMILPIAFASVGCGTETAAPVVDGTDTDAIAEYEAMIKADEDAANSGMSASE